MWNPIENKIREQVERAYTLGIHKGYHLGYSAGKAEAKNRGIIFAGINVQHEVEKILKEKGF